jgi:succinyl-diaminopimelate desuccinylase
MIYMRLRVRANREDLHSGLFGGAALNAAHVLIDLLRAGIDARGALAEGATAPSAAERRTWDRLPPGADVLSASGALPADDAAAAAFYERTLAAPAVDVTSLSCGDPERQANVIPSRAEAHLSVRVAPGQRADDCAAVVLALVEAGTPPGVEVEVDTWSSVDGALISADSPALERMRGSFRRALGVEPPLVRTGGSLPIVSALERRGIPVGLTGFAPAEARVHSTDERLYLPHLTAGVSLARAILEDLA